MTIAILKPFHPWQVSERAQLIARKGGGMVLLQVIDHRDQPKGNPFAADRSRLRCADDQKRALDDAVIDRLPWQGKGDDPLIAVDRSGPAAHRAFFT